MKIIRCIIALLAIAAGMPAHAEEAPGAALVGKVVRIYVKESANFFMETSLVRNHKGREHWTEVRFAAPLADGRKSEIVRLPESMKVEIGDLVSAQLANKRDLVPGLVPEVSRMLALVAKHDTLAAMQFDAPKAPAEATLPYVQALQALR